MNNQEIRGLIKQILQQHTNKSIPIIDIFAGIGGFSEGFLNFKNELNERVFDVVLSIEMEKDARETLKLRKFYKLPDVNNSTKTADYYRFLSGEITLDELYHLHPNAEAKADKIAWQAEMGSPEFPREMINQRIKDALNGAQDFVLIGSPPCQAYSSAGRARNNNNENYDPKQDKNQTLYKEYVNILADNSPIMFIMENVKGLLSAKLDGESVLDNIINDLRCPGGKHKYNIFSFIHGEISDERSYRDLVIRSENYGVPQKRHRVIILGVRDDFSHVVPPKLIKQKENTLASTILDLPRVRSGLTGVENTSENWKSKIKDIEKEEWFKRLKVENESLYNTMVNTLQKINEETLTQGDEHMEYKPNIDNTIKIWLCNSKLTGINAHKAKNCNVNDLYRYFYMSNYTELYGYSPTVENLPIELLPKHKNVVNWLKNGGKLAFNDRFRVQPKGSQSSTIIAQISYSCSKYIHPDPTQCRGLTPREAARLQTFPDDYYFCGAMTSQYKQIGNAVPPYLSYQIASIIYNIARQNGNS